MTKPITPDEAEAQQREQLPEQVLAAVNGLLATGRRTFRQDEVLDAVISLMPGQTRQSIFDAKWLDFEGAYEAVGWRVVYDKPGFNETGPATFTFSRKVSR